MRADLLYNYLSKRFHRENGATMYSVLNHLKDIYVGIIEDGYVPNDAYLNLAAYVLYAGFLMEE